MERGEQLERGIRAGLACSPLPSNHKTVKKTIQIIFVNVVLLFGMFCFVEISLLVIVNTKLLMYMPRAARMSLYNESRNIIQFLPGCAEYDPELTYVLKKNAECVFRNIEYRTRYRMNSLGLRDDEITLQKPEIIVLGDSFTMGWGVEQDETYAKIIEKKLGMRTLNAGISSYGTVREMKLLNRIDTNHLKYLLIQYSENDIMENHAFEKNRYTPTNEKWYLWLQQKRNYYFRKYTFTLIKLIKNNFIAMVKTYYKPEYTGNSKHDSGKYGEDITEAKKKEVDLFLHALKRNTKINYNKTKVIVFELSEPSWYTGDFIRHFQERASKDTTHEYDSFQVLDVMKRLEKDDFFHIDEHINHNGHSKVANMLVDEINRVEEGN